MLTTLMKRIEKGNARLFLRGEGQVLKSSGAKNDGEFPLDKEIKYPVKNDTQAALPRPGAGEGRLAPPSSKLGLAQSLLRTLEYSEFLCTFKIV